MPATAEPTGEGAEVWGESGPAAEVEAPAPFGALLRRHRLAAGLTQEALAERAGLSPRAIQSLERGHRRPYRETTGRLADALNLAPAERGAFEAAARPAPRRRAWAAAEPLPPPARPAVPSETRQALPNNLPASLDPLVGREAELAELRRLLTGSPTPPESHPRLVTLTGLGGSGKTRLALEVARSIATGSGCPEDGPGKAPDGSRGERFGDGVWLVELAALADGALVPQAVAAALGVREEPGSPPEAALVEALQPKRLLLVLDNCEHLIEPCARLVAGLLAAAPGLRVLATSRAPLRVRGEQQWWVPPLEVPDPQRPAALEALARYAAVRLFVARARAVAPAFGLTASNAGAVAEVCHRLDGLPLALELAAARIQSLPPAALLARLEHRLPLLTGGPRDAPTRQQTLRAALAWGHDLLEPAERALFRRLAVFAGGWTLEAAEAVGEPEPAPDALDGLVSKSLVRQEEGQDGEPRYRMLETVREFALERLEESGEAAATRQRHAAHYFALAARAAAALHGSGQVAWLARLEREHDNLRAALAWYGRADAATGLTLAVHLSPFWEMHAHHTEGRRWLAQFLEATGSDGAADDAKRGAALLATCDLALVLRELTAVRDLAEAALAAFEASSDGAGVAWARRALGRALHEQGDYQAARPQLESALARFEELGHRRGAAASLASLGDLARDQGDFVRAGALYAEGIARFRALGDKWELSHILCSLAGCARAESDYERASRLLAEALSLFRELDDQEGTRRALMDLGNLNRIQGDYAAARALLSEALELARRRGGKRQIALTLQRLGHVAAAERDDPQAWRLYEESLATFSDYGDAASAGVVLGDMGNLAHARGDDARARTLWAASVASARTRLGFSWLMGWTLGNVGALLVQTGDPAAGVRLLAAAYAADPRFPRSIDPDERETCAAALSAARAALGEAAHAAWAAGRAMAPAEAIAHALAALVPDPPAPGLQLHVADLRRTTTRSPSGRSQ